MLIILFLVSHFNFLFIPCGRLSWLTVSFLLHVKYPLLYCIVLYCMSWLKTVSAAGCNQTWAGITLTGSRVHRNGRGRPIFDASIGDGVVWSLSRCRQVALVTKLALGRLNIPPGSYLPICRTSRPFGRIVLVVMDVMGWEKIIQTFYTAESQACYTHNGADWSEKPKQLT